MVSLERSYHEGKKKKFGTTLPNPTVNELRVNCSREVIHKDKLKKKDPFLSSVISLERSCFIDQENYRNFPSEFNHSEDIDKFIL